MNSWNKALIYFLVLFISENAKTQITWEKDKPGYFNPAPPLKINGFRAPAIFDIVNRIPFITHPRGMDVYEGISGELDQFEEHVYTGKLNIAMPKYYRYNNGPVEKEGEYCWLKISINNRSEIMDMHSFLFVDETEKLNLPRMFTDTFPVRYESINGYPVGQTANTTFGNVRLFILNPAHRPAFKQLTREEYLRFWIGKLGLDIAEHQKGLDEGKESMRAIKANSSLNIDMTEMEKINHGMERWVEFLKNKKKYYEKMLAGLTTAEKKSPAFYSMPKEVAVMQDRDGNYPDKISGHLPYEPAEEGPSFKTAPVLKYNPDFYDPKLPKTAMQLMVIIDCFPDDSKEDLKVFLDDNFYPFIAYKELAGLMNK